MHSSSTRTVSQWKWVYQMTLIKSVSVGDINIGSSTGPIWKGPAIAPMLSSTLSALPTVKSTSLTNTPGDN